jgi:hypothetical protein
MRSYPVLPAGAGMGKTPLARAAAFGVLAVVFALSGGALLSACSSAGDSRLTLFADPGLYDFYSCDQIAAQQKTWQKREQELKQLMARAEQSTGGAFVNVIAYQADYVSAREQLQVLAATARAKNCPTAENWSSNSSIR